MKETLENFWNEYASDKCAAIDTDEERTLSRKVVRLQEAMNALLSKAQKSAVEQYVEALLEREAFSEKKAFFKGCKFTLSFVMGVGNFEK